MEEQLAEPTGADKRGDGADPDDRKRRQAHAGQDQRQREREFNPAEALPAVHPHTFGRFDDRGVDSRQADQDIAHQHDLRVGDQCDDRCARAQAKHRDQQHEERQAGDRVDHTQDPQHRAAQPAHTADQPAKRYGDRQRDRQRDPGELQVFAEQAADRAGIVDQKAHTGDKITHNVIACCVLRVACSSRPGHATDNAANLSLASPFDSVHLIDGGGAYIRYRQMPDDRAIAMHNCQ